MVDTGRMIKAYMSANDCKIDDLAEASGVSVRSVFRILNDECKLSYEVACGINKLLPEMAVEFLMSYDAKYQVQKRTFESETGITNSVDIIKQFQLKKLFPETSNNNTNLIKKGIEVFGLENLQKKQIDNKWIATVNFSTANNADDWDQSLWLRVAYKECLNQKETLIFNKDLFDSEFKRIKEIAGTTNIEMTLFNISDFCNKCGINFYFRPSIPNSRIKAVTIKDKDGHIFIFVSDLFKCIENLWIAFTHECMHINNGDYENSELLQNNKRKENENYVAIETARFFIGQHVDKINECTVEEVFHISEETNTPVGIVAEICRYKNNCYNNRAVNSLLHYYNK